MIDRLFSRVRLFLVLILMGAGLSACAIGRSVIEVEAPKSVAPIGDIAVKIIEVRDSRRFTANPGDPSEPSLGDAAEIGNPNITARAVARKRGGFGAAFGDVTLPEGATVAGLVRDAAQVALQDKGYRVVTETSPDHASALPLALEIEQFWAWFTPGFASVDASFKSRVLMTGDPLVGAGPTAATGFANLSGFAVTESDWANVIRMGVADLVRDMKERIRSPAALPLKN